MFDQFKGRKIWDTLITTRKGQEKVKDCSDLPSAKLYVNNHVLMQQQGLIRWIDELFSHLIKV